MLDRVRGRLTHANVIASLALVVALGGTGYAALRLPRNSVGPAQMSMLLRSVRPRCARSCLVQAAEGSQAIDERRGIKTLLRP